MNGIRTPGGLTRFTLGAVWGTPSPGPNLERFECHYWAPFGPIDPRGPLYFSRTALAYTIGASGGTATEREGPHAKNPPGLLVPGLRLALIRKASWCKSSMTRKV